MITGNGIVLKDFSIVHLKKNYAEIIGDEPVEELFQFTSVMEECINRQEMIKKRIEEIKYILASPSVPNISRGGHCYNPYECDFIGWCTKQDEQIKEGLFK